MTIVNVKLHDNDEKWTPIKSHKDDAGFDLKARMVKIPNSEEPANEGDGGRIIIQAGHRILVLTGVYLGLEPGYEAQIRPRSGMALKHGITIVNSPGTIDAGYRNEIGVILLNTYDKPYYFEIGDRIAQMVIKEVPMINLRIVNDVDNMSPSDRGLGGFGSTGTKTTILG